MRRRKAWARKRPAKRRKPSRWRAAAPRPERRRCSATSGERPMQVAAARNGAARGMTPTTEASASSGVVVVQGLHPSRSHVRPAGPEAGARQVPLRTAPRAPPRRHGTGRDWAGQSSESEAGRGRKGGAHWRGLRCRLLTGRGGSALRWRKASRGAPGLAPMHASRGVAPAFRVARWKATGWEARAPGRRCATGLLGKRLPAPPRETAGGS